MLSILILFNFSKAFDTVPHAPLLNKLRKVGCADEVVRWFASYLSGRRQAVLNHKNEVSGWLNTISGVPQGSVLGPLLFSVYVNDLPLCLSSAGHVMFADDLQIFLSFLLDQVPQGIHQASSEAANVARWAKDNRLNLNANKTKVMLMGSEQLLARVDYNSLPRV